MDYLILFILVVGAIVLKLRRNPPGEKIFQGTYDYMQSRNVYFNEEFQVYRNRTGLSMSFFSNMYGRVVSGEMFNLYVDYTVSKDYLPQKVFIEKKLGKYEMNEIYRYDKNKSIITYYFISGDEKKYLEIPVTSGFHISTPSAVSSMLFLKSREEDATGQSYYSLLGSENKWRFVNSPKMSSVVFNRPKSGTQNVRVGGEIISAPVYNLYENVDGGNIGPNMPYVEIYMSRYVNIPYMLTAKEGLCIKMRKLDNLLKEQ